MSTVLFRSQYLVDKPVITLKNQNLGKVTDVVLDNKNHQLKALLVGSSQPQKAQLVMFDDIKEIIEGRLFIQSKDSLKPADQIISQSDQGNFAGTKVVDSQNHQVGTLTDFYFNAVSGKIQDLEIKTQSQDKPQLKRLSVNHLQKLDSHQIILKKPSNSSKSSSSSSRHTKIYQSKPSSTQSSQKSSSPSSKPSDSSKSSSPKKSSDSSKKDSNIFDKAKSAIQDTL